MGSKCLYGILLLVILLLLTFGSDCFSQPEANFNFALKAGDQAILFKSVDENMKPVDMADMIKGKPLVLVTGSCT